MGREKLKFSAFVIISVVSKLAVLSNCMIRWDASELEKGKMAS